MATIELKKILEKIFWDKEFHWQLSGALIGAFLGFVLLLVSVQFYFDFQSLLFRTQKNGGHFIQLNKKVNIFNTLGGASGFSEKELEEIIKIEVVEKIGIFSSNIFKAGAYSDMLGFYTELFFESVTNDFLDVQEPSFRWNEDKNEIPIIVARDYLALYNFGFAPSQGLPQISAKTAQRLEIDIQLEGNGIKKSFKGKVVGFSDRINSILVPSEFMDWANDKFGNDNEKQPTRIILQVANPLDKALLDLIEKNGYEISTGRLIGEEFALFSKIAFSVLAILGLVILLLATIVFLFAFELVISKNKHSIQLLLEQGFAPGQISKIMTNRFIQLFIVLIICVLFTLFAMRFMFVKIVENQGFELGVNLNYPTYIIGVIVIAILFWQNISKINKAVLKLS